MLLNFVFSVNLCTIPNNYTLKLHFNINLVPRASYRIFNVDGRGEEVPIKKAVRCPGNEVDLIFQYVS